jgi:hypothetical protein
VPPELDLSKPKAAEPLSKSQCQIILESLPGPGLLADKDGKIVAGNEGWDEAMTRAARSDLSRNALLGRLFLNLLPDETQHPECAEALAEITADRQKKFTCTAELGSASRPFAMNFTVQAIRREGQFEALLIQGMDVTQDLVTRMALLDRERRLRDLRAIAERQNAEITALKQRAEQAGVEKDGTVARQAQEIADLYQQIAQVTSQKEVVIARQIEEMASLQQQIAQAASQKDENTAKQAEEILALREQIDLILSQRDAMVASQAEELATARELNKMIATQRDALSDELIAAFGNAPAEFEQSLCEIARNLTDAVFATLAVYSDHDQKLHFTAHHNAPEFHRFAIDQNFLELGIGEGPAGTAAQNHCTTKFDHLLEREDFAKWAPLAEQNGYNCIWAFPIEDRDGLCAVLQLYFTDPDVALPVEQYSVIAALGPIIGPLLRAARKWPETTEAAPLATTTTSGRENFRVLAAGLSEEFANLLTGVLGHSSLVASEMGEGHRALDDVRAIERSARNAARLTRRLSALSGAAHRNAAPVELTAFLPHYVTRDRAEYFPTGVAELSLPDGGCSVHAEGAALEIILDGMADHARMNMLGTSAPRWSVSVNDGLAVLTLDYEGPAAIPTGWEDPHLRPQPHQPLPELFFSREAVQAFGGTLEIREEQGISSMILTLPMIRQTRMQDTAV